MAFLHCFLTRPHLWFIKEPGIQTLIRWLFWGTAAKSLQSCPSLCDPIDGSPPGSTIPGILQARTPEWVAISFSNAWKWKVKVKSLSRVRLLVIPWTAAYQAPPSMGFSRQEYWSGVPLPSLFWGTNLPLFRSAAPQLKSLPCLSHSSVRLNGLSCGKWSIGFSNTAI